MKTRQILRFLPRIREYFRLTIARLRNDSSSRTHLALVEEEDKKEHQILKKLGYTLGGKLGEGSFSLVMSAYSEKHRRDVAVKVIEREKVNKMYTGKFLSREIELVKNINHENIVRFLNIIETKTSVYVVMSLAANGNLLETIKKAGYIDERRACRWFHHLVDGIAFCHGMGIAHRDLKCENLLLDKNYILKITDFSFARANLPRYIINNEENLDRRIELSSTYCGSYAYACPEILFRKPYEPHLSDIWSMGVVLYAMLSGRLPFDDRNLETLLRDVQNPVRFYRRPALSTSVKNLVVRILSPSKIRIYIPKIRKDIWYIETFEEKAVDERTNISNTSCS